MSVVDRYLVVVAVLLAVADVVVVTLAVSTGAFG